ncbi:MAG: type II toxin-antitoxin system HicA family toxin [Nitrospinae bacterium]|nr:type II toxin-antitoxin system HicA family toxin [Nitrospinota bacterium]
MSAREKLVRRMKSIPADFTFDELPRVFQRAGFELEQRGGSHCYFINAAGDIFHTWRTHGRAENRMPRSDVRAAVKFLEQRRLI